ncbi:MAG: DegV family protein [Eggerthellaceae bacterium]|jgi:DegV family protein with EDD domain
MGFAVVTDSAADINPEEAQRYSISVLPMTIMLDGEEYRDQVDITSEEFYDLMNASDNLPKTAQPSPYDFAQVFKKLAAEGADHIISIHIAAVLSGTAQSAAIAAEQVDVPVTVIDCCGVTVFQGLVVRYAAELRDKGIPAQEAVARIRRAIPRIHFRLVPETLDNLLKGGRLSPLEAKAAGLLNVKPIITFDEKGVLKVTSKARGMKGAENKMRKMVRDATAEEGIQRIRFTHSRNEKELSKLKAMLEADKVKYVDFGTTPCGATVSTHLGTGAIGIATLAVEE